MQTAPRATRPDDAIKTHFQPGQLVSAAALAEAEAVEAEAAAEAAQRDAPPSAVWAGFFRV
jgi:hypothetical protein